MTQTGPHDTQKKSVISINVVLLVRNTLLMSLK